MIYRRSKHGRYFFKIEGEKITRVINKFQESEIYSGTNCMVLQSATDLEYTEESSKEDFDKQFSEANAFINLPVI